MLHRCFQGAENARAARGVVEAIEESIPPARALKSIDATGKLVMPGLIDLHCHVYPYGSAIGIPKYP